MRNWLICYFFVLIEGCEKHEGGGTCPPVRICRGPGKFGKALNLRDLCVYENKLLKCEKYEYLVNDSNQQL